LTFSSIAVFTIRGPVEPTSPAATALARCGAAHAGPNARKDWQARRDSNPQPPVLETGALPIELLAYLERRGTRDE
jgi:hypothetical protein